MTAFLPEQKIAFQIEAARVETEGKFSAKTPK